MSGAIAKRRGQLGLWLTLSLSVSVATLCLWEVHAARSAVHPASARPIAEESGPGSTQLFHRDGLSSPYVRQSPVLTGAAAPPTRLAPMMVEALKDPNGAAKKERLDFLARLKQSGPSSAPWTRDATIALERLGNHGGKHVDARFSNIECWAAGCSMHAVYPGMQEYYLDREALTTELVMSYPKGMKTITGPEVQPNGEIESYWILSHPDR
jgi:hypothetical protein